MSQAAPHFVIKNRPDTPNERGRRFEFSTIAAAVDELSGRPGIAAYVLPKLHGSKVRIFVATDKRSPWRQLGNRGGFIVERVA